MGSSSLGHTWLTTSPPFLCRTRSSGLAVDAYAPAMAALKRTAISNEMEEGDPVIRVFTFGFCFSILQPLDRWKDRLTVLEHFVCADDDRNST